MKTPEYFDSIASASSSLGIDIETLRAAKAAGCLAFRSGRVYAKPLKAWLSGQRRKKRPAQPLGKLAEGSSVPGLPEQLQRLGLAAARAGAAHDEDPTDPRKLSAWLAIVEKLVKADVSLEQSRRDSGEMLSRRVIEQVISQVCYLMHVGIPETALRLAREIDQPQLYAAIAHGLRNLNTTIAAGASGAVKLPDWAVLAFERGSHGALTPDPAGFAGRREFFGALLGQITERSFMAELARLSTDAPVKELDWEAFCALRRDCNLPPVTREQVQARLKACRDARDAGLPLPEPEDWQK